MMVQFADDQVAICEKKQGDTSKTLNKEKFHQCLLEYNVKLLWKMENNDLFTFEM